jgi:hypothetical protein
MIHELQSQIFPIRHKEIVFKLAHYRASIPIQACIETKALETGISAILAIKRWISPLFLLESQFVRVDWEIQFYRY